MVPFIYLLRHPLSIISPALYDSVGHHHVTLAIERAVGAAASHSAEVVHAEGESHLEVGEQLTASELLTLLLDARKVVIL
jgi:hypothetical protein